MASDTSGILGSAVTQNLKNSSTSLIQNVDESVVSALFQREAFIPTNSLPVLPVDTKSEVSLLRTGTVTGNSNEIVITFVVPANPCFLPTFRLWFHLSLEAISYIPDEYLYDVAPPAEVEGGVYAGRLPAPNKIAFCQVGGLYNFFTSIQIEINETVVATYSTIPPAIQYLAEKIIQNDRHFDAAGVYTGGTIDGLCVHDFLPTGGPVGKAVDFTWGNIIDYVNATYPIKKTHFMVPMDFPFSFFKLDKVLNSGTVATIRFGLESDRRVISYLYNSKNSSIGINAFADAGSTSLNDCMVASWSLLPLGLQMTAFVEPVIQNTIKAEAPLIASGVSNRMIFSQAEFIDKMVFPPVEYNPVNTLDPGAGVDLITDRILVTSSTIASNFFVLPIVGMNVGFYKYTYENKKYTTLFVHNSNAFLPGSVITTSQKMNNVVIEDFRRIFAPLFTASGNMVPNQQRYLRDYYHMIQGERNDAFDGKFTSRKGHQNAYNAQSIQNSNSEGPSSLRIHQGDNYEYEKAYREYNNQLLKYGQLCIFGPNLLSTLDELTPSRTGSYAATFEVTHPKINFMADGSVRGVFPGIPFAMPYNFGTATARTIETGMVCYVLTKRPYAISTGPMGTATELTRLDLVAAGVQLQTNPTRG